MDYIIGLDLDNTLVSYDQVMHRVAVQRELIHANDQGSKRNIRERVRQRPDGELEWRKLQAAVYGPRMGEASLVDGVPPFIRLCQRRGSRLYIISHKTEFSDYDPMGTNLRKAAMVWMAGQRFFEPGGLGLTPDQVYFEDTRLAKVRRIGQLGCTHFIDDLEETFMETSFPAGVEKILFDPGLGRPSLPGVKVAGTWRAIARYLFDASS